MGSRCTVLIAAIVAVQHRFRVVRVGEIARPPRGGRWLWAVTRETDGKDGSGARRQRGPALVPLFGDEHGHRSARSHEALRADASPSTTSRSGSRRAASPGSWGRTAPGSRRRCVSSSDSTPRRGRGTRSAAGGTAIFGRRSARSARCSTPVRRIPAPRAQAICSGSRGATACRRSRVDEVLELVGLAEAARKRTGGFSLGMAQRLGIAAAMLGDPPVLMFDEPDQRARSRRDPLDPRLPAVARRRRAGRVRVESSDERARGTSRTTSSSSAAAA